MAKTPSSPKLITQYSLFYWVLHRYRLLQLLIFILIIGSVAFRALPLELQRRIVNEAIELQQTELLFYYCGLYLASVVLSSLLKYLVNVLEKYVGQKILIEIRRELYAHVLRLPLGFFRRTAPGSVITALSAELNAIGHFIGGAITVPLISIFTLLAFGGYMVYLDPLMALISLSIYPVELVIVPLLQHRYNKHNTTRIQVVRAMNDVINEGVSGIHEVQGNAGFKVELDKYLHRVTELFGVLMRLFWIKYGIKLTNNLFQNFGPFLLFLIGGYMAIHGKFTLGALVAFLSAYEKVYDPWKEIIEYYQSLQDARVRYHRVMEQFDLAPEFAIHPRGRAPYALAGNIEIADLSYMVEGRIQLLEAISLAVKAGDRVALVGFSGSGKSTLAMILGQLYRYRRGNVRFDGKELSHLTKADISRNLAFVAQHPFIFGGTIRDNLLYGCRARIADAPEAASEEVLPDTPRLLEMVREVGFADDVIRFGLDSILQPSQVSDRIDCFFRMRHLVHRELADKLHELVEVFDVNRFMEHISIYRNLIFGHFYSGEYQLENLPQNPLFMRFLKKEGLYMPLLQLGWEIASETVDLLRDVEDKKYFLEQSPLEEGEFQQCQALLDGIRDKPLDRIGQSAEAMLLILAFRLIPAQHKMVAVSGWLKKEIVNARLKFILEIGKIDPEDCELSVELMENLYKEPPQPIPEAEDKVFSFYCPKEYLYSLSLMDNILFGVPRTERTDELEELRGLIVRLLEGEDLLNEVMDVGLEFNVGTKGDNLSGGQQQKIAIARALLKRSPVLILDEATASLDNRSQTRIQDFIDQRLGEDTTVVAVIHRLDMTPAYDRIVVLKAGRLIETGSYQELMDKKGVFYGLVQGS